MSAKIKGAQMTNARSDIRAYLREYADFGLKIFPLKVRGKAPACAHGFKDATNDISELNKLWGDKQYNIGLPSGRENGLVIIDVDDREKWEHFLSQVDKELPDGPKVSTGKGFHLYFRYPQNWSVGNKQNFELGFDVRGEGGYVVAPHSIHENGYVYEATQGGDLPEVPKWLLAMIGTPDEAEQKAPVKDIQIASSKSTPYGKKALDDECQALARSPEGTRNAALNTAAFSIGQLVTSGDINPQDALNALCEAAKSAGLDTREVEKTLASGFKAGQIKPRAAKLEPIAEVLDETISPLEQLRSYAVNGSSEEMAQKMLDDVYVLKDIAIMGQWTTFYAAPNTGKTLLTLWLLIEQVRDKELDPENVFYVNADDNFKGAYEKLKLLEGFDIQMLLPNEKAFKTASLLPLLDALITKDEARGVVVILDTLKKFTTVMDKTKASDFGKLIRAFVSKGGTTITLAHTNKHKDEDGKSVFGGTSDILDDCDCSYILDVEEGIGIGKTWVTFKNIKSRGDVADKVMFTYSKAKGDTYQDVINSVERLDDKEVVLATNQRKTEEKAKNDADVIELILDVLGDEELLTKEVVAAAKEQSIYTQNCIKTVMRDYAGEDYLQGHRWTKRKGESRNQILYKKLPDPMKDNISKILSASGVEGGG